MDSKENLISKYVSLVQEKDVLLSKLATSQLSQEELQQLLMFNEQQSKIVSDMIECGLIEIEVTEQ